MFVTSRTCLQGCADFALTARSGPHGGLPATGGDILLHVQADSAAAVAAAVGQLTSQLPEGATVNTTYGEDYLGGRDLSGFPVGITSPATPAAREDAAVEPATGGSYVLAQRWYVSRRCCAAVLLCCCATLAWRLGEALTDVRDMQGTQHGSAWISAT